MQVQALVAQTVIDPGASASWLAYNTEGSLHSQGSSAPGSLQ